MTNLNLLRGLAVLMIVGCGMGLTACATCEDGMCGSDGGIVVSGESQEIYVETEPTCLQGGGQNEACLTEQFVETYAVDVPVASDVPARSSIEKVEKKDVETLEIKDDAALALSRPSMKRGVSVKDKQAATLKQSPSTVTVKNIKTVRSVTLPLALDKKPLVTEESRVAEPVKVETPLVTEESKVAESIKVETPVVTEEPKVAEPVKVETPVVTEEPKVEEPVKVETPVVTEEPKVAEPVKVETPVVTEEPKVAEPVKVEDLVKTDVRVVEPEVVVNVVTPTEKKVVTTITETTTTTKLQPEVIVEKESQLTSLQAQVAYGQQIHDWEALPGDTLRTLLMDWGEKSGWTVVWKLDRDYHLEAGVVFRGNFTDVAAAIIRSFARATPAPIGTFYKGNRVLVVNTQEDENER
jgi:hypothetical protein